VEVAVDRAKLCAGCNRPDGAPAPRHLLIASVRRCGSGLYSFDHAFDASGKSSLVRAGLMHMMAQKAGWWTLPPILPGADPVASLAREPATAAEQLSVNWRSTRRPASASD
jgi:hypothetical protein